MRVNPSYCYHFVTHEGCARGDMCRKRHDIGKCECGLVLLIKDFWSHKKGKKHQSRMINSAHSTTEHYGAPEARGATQRCSQCNRNISAPEQNLHAQKHAREQRLIEARAAFEQAELNKNGINVSHTQGIDFGVVENAAIDLYIDVSIRGAEPMQDPDVLLLSCRMRSSIKKDEHRDKFSVTYVERSKWIKCQIDRKINVVFHPSYEGRYEDTLELIFLRHRSNQRFIITRRVEATVGSREDHEQLKPTAPYVRRQPHSIQFTTPLNTSIRPPVWTETKWVTRLPEYTPPLNLIKAAYGPAAYPHKKALANVRGFLPKVLNETTYGKHIQILLYVEEEKMKQDLDAYSLYGAEVTPDYPRYNLQVKGLAEGRPSVLVGDFILFSHAVDSNSDDFDDPKRIWYQGCVHQVHQNHLSLRFGGDFNIFKGTKFDVRFVLNRLPIRRMHNALSNKFNPTRLLFPKLENIISRRATPAEIRDITLFYRPIGEDEEQLETVAAIIHQRPGSVPFVVFGPPGTGKTVTIAEAMRQLLVRSPDVRILACAPSNSAADLIAQGLLGLGSSQLFRLNSLSRKFEDLPKTLRSVSQVNGNKVFAIPQREDLEKFRVIVSTCISGGIPEGLGLKRGHFTHIFIDEAGQAKEPEVMVPIKSIAGPSTNIILAGDNQQLGPVVHSRLARDLGLKTSYLDRLMGLDVYDLKKFSGVTIVKLVKNFRSHLDILRFSNDEFYDSELQACGNPMLTRIFENSDELPKKKFPIIFHGIVGRDQQEASSPSFFNIDEATQVKKYCKSLVEGRKLKTRPEHIGVITPYHAQRCKILNLLHQDVKLRGIKVGSVEEFQGQERRIIILSTVRSSTNYVVADIRKSLGFVANPRRFNVAVTRAQALLIVIGNPMILSLDPLWRKFLNYIHTRGGWRGREINWDPEVPINPSQEGYDAEMRDRAEREMEETLERLKALIINVNDGSEFGIDLTDSSDSDSDHDETPIFREAE